MRAFAKIAFLVAAVTLLPCERSDAFLMLLRIRTPQQCPDGLTVKSKPGTGGMIAYDVSVDAEEIAHAGELYRGRVRAHAVLKLATSQQQIASVTLHGATEGSRTRYQFTTSRSAAKASELQLGVSLYEKDGFATVGGGVSMQVYLAGFAPPEGPPTTK